VRPILYHLIGNPQASPDINRFTLVIEPHCFRIDLVGGSLTSNVASMRSPLPSYFASRICYANRTTLVVRSSRSIIGRSLPRCPTPHLPSHSRVPHYALEERGPNRVLVPRLPDRRLSRSEPDFPPVVSPHGSPDHAGQSVSSVVMRRVFSREVAPRVSAANRRGAWLSTKRSSARNLFGEPNSVLALISLPVG
jgi:hypothetical protein